MKRNVVFSTILSTALAVSLNAQSGSGSAAGTPQDPSASNQPQVTVTGCLQNADTAGTIGTSGSGSATGTAESSAAASSAGQYILAKAKIGSGSASMSGGTASGTSGSPTSSATGSPASGTTSAMGDKFMIVGGSQNDKLKEYVNSQVEITGRILPKGSAAGAATGSSAGTGSATGSATGSSASGTGASASSMSAMSDAQRLQVASVRQISSTCASGQ